MDTDGAEDDRRLRWTAKSCGPDAPTLASSWRVNRKRRWQTSMVTGESTKETVKTIACGNAGFFRWTCGDYARVLCFTFAREAAGALGARHSPRPLFSKGEDFMHSPGASRRGNADPCLECLGCLKIEVAVREAISQTHSSCPDLIRASINLRKSVFEKMDHRVEPGDDGSLWCRGAMPHERLHDSPVRRFA